MRDDARRDRGGRGGPVGVVGVGLHDRAGVRAAAQARRARRGGGLRAVAELGRGIGAAAREEGGERGDGGQLRPATTLARLGVLCPVPSGKGGGRPSRWLCGERGRPEGVAGRGGGRGRRGAVRRGRGVALRELLGLAVPDRGGGVRRAGCVGGRPGERVAGRGGGQRLRWLACACGAVTSCCGCWPPSPALSGRVSGWVWVMALHSLVLAGFDVSQPRRRQGVLGAA